MIITASYFHGTLTLPNIKTSGGTGVAQAVQTVGELELESFMLQYEREFLQKLLGRKLAADFTAGLSEDPVAEKWQDLKDQIYMKHDGYYYSPVANYIYFWVMQAGRTTTTTKGEQKPTQDYALVASESRKMVRAWNDMLPMIDEIRYFILRNPAYKGYGCGERFNIVTINGI